MQRKNFLEFWKEFGGICGTRQSNNYEITMKGFIMYKIFILGFIALVFLLNLPNIIIGFFTNPLQAIAGFIVCWIMVSSIVNDKG